MQDLSRVKRKNLVETVVQEFEQMIKSGQLKPGERLPSHEMLAEELGVGRSTIREAIQALQLVGLVEIHPGRGSFICENPEQTLMKTTASRLRELRASELYEARFALEKVLVGLAAERASAGQIGEMECEIEGMRQSLDDPRECIRHDVAFHLKIAEASGNRLLEQFYLVSRELLHQTLRYWANIDGVSEDTFMLHTIILEAIKARDKQAAVNGVSACFNYIELVLSSLDGVPRAGYQPMPEPTTSQHYVRSED
jgi:GntR family transcriptional regulator, transcriptional repressor for pyruvate dehydrogenase complex